MPLENSINYYDSTTVDIPKEGFDKNDSKVIELK